MLKLHKYQNLDASCAHPSCDQFDLDHEPLVCAEDNQLAFFELLHSFKCDSTSPKEQGSSFERLFVDFLRYDKKYQDLYVKVQLFDEWAAEHPMLAYSLRDTGIDVVATNRMDFNTTSGESGVEAARSVRSAGEMDAAGGVGASASATTAPAQTYTAFQCKFYAPDTVISKADIDSFCNASDKTFFSERYIVTTNCSFSANALHSFADKAVPVKLITASDLANSSIDWSAYKLSAASRIVSVKRALRPYQQEAVQKTIEGFESSSRGRLIMACGTGKTFVALNIAESLPTEHPLVLVLVPSIALLSQFLTEWKHYASCPLTALAVCSDNSVGKGFDDNRDFSSLAELPYPATTSPEELARCLKAQFSRLESTPKTNVTAYHSSHELGVVLSGSGSNSLSYSDWSNLDWSREQLIALSNGPTIGLDPVLSLTEPHYTSAFATCYGFNGYSIDCSATLSEVKTLGSGASYHHELDALQGGTPSSLPDASASLAPELSLAEQLPFDACASNGSLTHVVSSSLAHPEPAGDFATESVIAIQSIGAGSDSAHGSCRPSNLDVKPSSLQGVIGASVDPVPSLDTVSSNEISSSHCSGTGACLLSKFGPDCFNSNLEFSSLSQVSRPLVPVQFLAGAPCSSLFDEAFSTTDLPNTYLIRSGSNLNFAPLSVSDPYSGSASCTDADFTPLSASYPLDPNSSSLVSELPDFAPDFSLGWDFNLSSQLQDANSFHRKSPSGSGDSSFLSYIQEGQLASPVQSLASPAAWPNLFAMGHADTDCVICKHDKLGSNLNFMPLSGSEFCSYSDADCAFFSASYPLDPSFLSTQYTAVCDTDSTDFASISFNLGSGSNLNFAPMSVSEPVSRSASSTVQGFSHPFCLASYPLDLDLLSTQHSAAFESDALDSVVLDTATTESPLQFKPVKSGANLNLSPLSALELSAFSGEDYSPWATSYPFDLGFLSAQSAAACDVAATDFPLTSVSSMSGANLNFAPMSVSEPVSRSASSTVQGFSHPFCLASYPLAPDSLDLQHSVVLDTSAPDLQFKVCSRAGSNFNFASMLGSDPCSGASTAQGFAEHQASYQLGPVSCLCPQQISTHSPSPQRHMIVVVSTYQSIRVVATAQHKYGIPPFDLIICDEAHRTTGCFDLSDCRVKHNFDESPFALAASHLATPQPPTVASSANPISHSTLDPTLTQVAPVTAHDEHAPFVEGVKLSLHTDATANTADANATAATTTTANVTAQAKANADANAHATANLRDCVFSSFTAVHQDSFVLSKRRLFMTATQKVFVDDQRSNKYEVYSMDNPDLYGPCFYSLSFEQAVDLGCLVDYKVLVLGIDPKLLPVFDHLSVVDQANCAKVIGTCKALSKFGVLKIDDDPDPMRRAVCFAQVIDSDDPRKVASKKLARYFEQIVSEYAQLVKLQALQSTPDSAIAQEYAFFQKHAPNFVCKHIDGNMSALQKNALLEWMRAPLPPHESRLLFNVRCLSEGVDLPALDAIVFLSARRSIVEVLQALGRVMRKAPGKKFGYVILPVILRDQDCPDETFYRYPEFRVVWQVLNALKSFYPDKEMVDSRLNKLDSHIQIECLRSPLMPRKVQALSSAYDSASDADLSRRSSPFVEPDEACAPSNVTEQDVLTIAENIKALILRHQGNRHTWLAWAAIVAQIFQEQVQLLSLQITQHPQLQQLFTSFQHDMSNALRIQLPDQAVIEMLSQHIVVRPILVELFKGFPFTAYNPIAKAMDQMITALEKEGLIKATQELQAFYDSVASRMHDVKTLEDRQIVILDLFDSFFKHAFPKLQEKLGIVYTPIEVVDFMNHSVNDLLKREFGQDLAASKVHVLDPFAGMGTFIARMMLDPQLLPDAALERKYRQELHAFEVMPIAYYIASINMEAVYAERMYQTPEQYEPNRIMVLTDTFADVHDWSEVQGAAQSLQDADLEINQQRREQVESQPLWVILGNPPYSVGQSSQNDDNQNLNYPTLDARISETYVAQVSSQSNKTSLYDTYLKAFRWASDHLGEQGIVAFVSNAGWIDSAVASGVRRCLRSEFSSIYIFHLKGNQRTAGEQCSKEGGKIFGDGCRAPIAITILVKNPQAQEQGKIYFASVEDYLSREAKLAVLSDLKSIVNAPLVELTQDEHGDWLDHRRDDFAKFLPLLSKHPENELTVFSLFSRGITTGRDAWSFNASSQKLQDNFTQCIGFYNEQVEKSRQLAELGQSFVKDNDPTKIKWDDSLISRLQQKKLCPAFDATHIVTALYRPFVKEKLYFDLAWVTRRYQVLKLFPCPEARNLVISVQGQRANSAFSCLMTNCISSSGLIDNDQLLPRYVYTPLDEFLARESNLGLSKSQLLQVNGVSVFTSAPCSTNLAEPRVELNELAHLLEGKVVLNGFVREDAITPQALSLFRQAYAEHADKIDADSVFYYVYGLLHSEDFRHDFATNLQKEYVKIPRVATFADFAKFEQAGRYLAHLHVEYEQVEPYAQCQVKISQGADFKVSQLRYGRFAGMGKGNAAKDKTMIVYNEQISIHNIPLEAQDYVVNRLSALDWLIKLCGVTTDKSSGLVNDYNKYADEVEDERYILDLILRVITVSCESIKTIKSLPALTIHPLDKLDN